MLFLFTISVVVLAVISFTVFVRRRSSSKLLPKKTQINILAENFRPLFAPDEADLRDAARAEKIALDQARHEQSERLRKEKIAAIADFQTIWQNSPNRQKTIELISRAAHSESSRTYQETVEMILLRWQVGEIENISADELAQLLESHFWILPMEERASGEKFWLSQTIADLRRKS